MALRNKKRIIAILLIILFVGVFMFLRGPYMSNLLKSLILPEVKKAVGLQVIVQKMRLNLLPIYVEAVEVKAFDEEGEKVFTAESVKAYLGLSDILARRLIPKAVVVKKPQVWLDRTRAAAAAGGLDVSAKSDGESATLNLKSIVIRDGEVFYRDEALKGLFEARGLNAEVILRDRPEVNVAIAELIAAIENWPELKGGISANFFIGREGIEIKRVDADVGGSTLSGTGNFFYDRSGSFRLDINVLADTVKELLSLDKPGYGSIRARGTLTLTEELLNPLLDFDVKGDFYLQTLLKAVKARTSHELTGLVSFNGSLGGSLLNLSGRADARLRNGTLYNIEVDDIQSKVAYEDRILRITEGKAKLYSGRGEVDISLHLPRAKPFTVEAEFQGVDSPPAFQLLGLTWMHLPAGKVKGRVKTSGMRFDPEGWMSYEASQLREDPVGRFSNINAKYKMKNDVVTLTEIKAESEASSLTFKGTYDIKAKLIDFKGDMHTDDVRDLMTPYYGSLTGSGEFHGGVSGHTDDPAIKGRVLIHDTFLEDYPLGEVEGEILYRKNLFAVTRSRAVHGKSDYRVQGAVSFPTAEKLLEFNEPGYDLKLDIKGADLGGILRLHNISIPIEGTADSKAEIQGSGVPRYLGSAELADVSMWNLPVSAASLNFSYDFKDVAISNATLKSGESVLMLDGRITKGGGFKFKASSEGLYLRDAIPRELPFNYRLALDAEGSGTIERPEINLSAKLSEGVFSEWPIGGGMVEAALKGDDLALDAKVLDGKMSVKGGVTISEDMLWNADVEVDRGRLDFLATKFLKTIPEDLMLSITGRSSMSGTVSDFKADVAIKQLTMAMFGQSFTNDEDIFFSIDNGLVEFPEFKLRSGTTSVNVQGLFKYKDFYDVMIYGTSSLAPLKAFSDRIALLRGSARYVLALQGEWERPKINGGIDISNGSFGIEGVPQRLAEVNGYSYFEDDVVVIEKLDAKLGGGDVEVKGVMTLDGTKAKSVNLDMLLNNVNVTLTKGFKANIGGSMIFRGSPGSRLLTGEVAINRAEYKDRIEWKSWLLAVKRTEAAIARGGPFDDVSLSLRLYGDRDMIIDNNLATAKLNIDLVLRGTIGDPQLLGRIESTEGKVYFRNSEFRIAHATADFADTGYSDPYVDIVAETTAKGYHIWLTLEGKLDQLDMTLLSDPELEDEEILSLLTVGEYGENLRGLEGSIGAAEASSVLTGGFQDVVEERLRELTGVTRFTIDPYVSKKTGSITPRLTVTKRLAGEDIYVTYSSSMSTSEEQEIMLEYIINRNVSLQGGQDDLGSLGGDVKFRFFFK